MGFLRSKRALWLSLAFALLAVPWGQATGQTVSTHAQGHHAVTQGQYGHQGVAGAGADAGGSGELWSDLVRRGHSRRLQAPIEVASKEAIEILWFWGSPRAITHIGQGETVKWVWWDDRPHSIEGEGTGLTMFKGEGGWTETVARRGFSYTYKFDNPGTFNYHCHNHSEIMVGTVIVKPKYNIGGVKILWYDGVSLGGASAIIEEGDTVTWQWLDDLGHSLQDANGDPEFFPGKGGGGFPITESGFQYNKTYTKAGIYAYVCGQHITTMRGAIQVVPKGSTLPPLPEVLSSKAPTLPREGAGTPPPGVDSGDILISSKPNPSVAYPQTSWGAAWLVSLVLGLVLFMV